MSEGPYSMRMSLSALKHLGIGLYSNIPAVLSEAVANSWDADAENVDICIDYDKRTITIRDDGHGMSVDDANKKYLYVGYERRKKCKTSPLKGRAVMGRKGIGKLSLFSIAHTIEVRSCKDGDAHGFAMKVGDIEKAIGKESGEYHPEPLPKPDLKRGTVITLSDLQLQLRRTGALKRKLARRFTVMDDGFNVTFNGERIRPEDRGYQEKLQYLWVLGERGRRAFPETGGVKRMRAKPEITINNEEFAIDGWIGTAKKSGQLVEDAQSLNRIAVIVRGKMAQDDMLEDLGEGGMYSKYVVGEIHADFLDLDDKDDIATSGRQKFKEDDERYRELRGKIREILKTVETKWTRLRNQDGKKAALMIPEIKSWYNELPADRKTIAESLFGKINHLPVDNDEQRRHLFVNGILAFESLRLKDMLDKLEHIDAHSLEQLSGVFSQLDDLEATMFYQTTKTRLGVIGTLRRMVENNSLERAIQQHVFDHLWLIDPTWERIAGSERMEETLAAKFKKQADGLTDEEKRGRVDIRYKSVGNKHVIIELKRPDELLDTGDLVKQVEKYHTTMTKILESSDRRGEPVEIVCMLGRPLKGWDVEGGRRRTEDAIGPYSARIVFYDSIIENAERAYSEYLGGKRRMSRVYDLIKSVESGPA